MPIETVAIIGKGAVGLLHGSKIAKAVGSKHLEYVMDDERYLRHRTDRTVINGEDQNFTTIPAGQAKPVDLVILAVKATGLDQAINSMEGLVGPETRIVSLLNGVTSEEAIAARYGWKHLVLAITQGMDAVFIDNALTFTHPGEIRLGAAPHTEAGVVEDIAELLERAGISHTVEKDIRRRMWTKLMMNVGINQTCMVYGGTYGSALADSEQNRCLIAAMREAKAVANAEGIALTEDDLNEMISIIANLDPNGMPSNGSRPHQPQAYRGGAFCRHHHRARRASRIVGASKPLAAQARPRNRILLVARQTHGQSAARAKAGCPARTGAPGFTYKM